MRQTISVNTREDIKHEIRNVFQTQTFQRTKAKMDELQIILGEQLEGDSFIAFILLCANVGYEESLKIN